MSIRHREILAAVGFLIFAAVGFYLTGLIDLSFSPELERFTGPRAYPRTLLAVIAVLAVLLLLGALRLPRAAPVRAEGAPPRRWRCLAALGALALFVALFETLGFILAMPPLLIAIALLNGANRLWPVVVTSLVAAAICLLLFRYGLNTVLPEGLLGIDQIL